jgi:hypothetical protein
MLCFTPTVFLELDVVRTSKNSFARVSRVRDIKTLLYLKRKKNFDNYVCFAFGKKATKLYQDQEIEFRYFLIPSVDELIEKLMDLMVINGATVSNNTILHEAKQTKQPEINRVPQAPLPTKSDKNDLLKRIGELESLIDDNLDYNNIQELVACYGKATEIFSQDPNSEFMIFTVKTQSLLARPDIQAVLDSNRHVPLLDMEFHETAGIGADTNHASVDRNAEKSRFKFTGSDDEEEESSKKTQQSTLNSSSNTKDQLDLLSLDLGGTQGTKPIISDERLPQHSTPQKGVDLLSLETLAFEDSGKKTADKLIKRKKQGDDHAPKVPQETQNEIDLLSLNMVEKQIITSTPEKPNPFGSSFIENAGLDGSILKLESVKSTSSSKKLGNTPIMVKKDSYSDEENKFVIG